MRLDCGSVVMATRQALRRIVLDSGGGAALVTALAMPVVVGGLGLGSEVGYWYFNQRKVQNAADVAAYAAATELRAGSNAASIAAAATAAAERTGYVPARGVITTNSPPATGPNFGDPDSVEVTVAENLPRMFSGLFASGAVPVTGRAVANITGGQQTCVLALDPSASGAVTFIGSTSTILIGCNVHSNSLAGASAIVTGSASVQAPCMSASGTVDVDAGLSLTECVAPYEYADQEPDPYADLPVPDMTQPCKAQNTFGGGAGSVHNITAGRYCSGMDMRRIVNMAPGTYIVDGGSLQINSTASVQGSGVTFYLVNGATASFNGGAHLDLDAPSTGTYAGVLMYVDRNEPYNTHSINGDSSSAINGAIYAAASHIQMNGGTDVGGGCTQVVGRTITFSGNSAVGINCTGSGVRDIRTSQLVRLVE
jgi:Flp pilus assembly protein TadG